MLTNRRDGSQQLWLNAKLATLNEQGALSYGRPKPLKPLKRPSCSTWEAAYLALRWGGHSESTLTLMRSLGKTYLRAFLQEKAHLTMTLLLKSVAGGAVPHATEAPAATSVSTSLPVAELSVAPPVAVAMAEPMAEPMAQGAVPKPTEGGMEEEGTMEEEGAACFVATASAIEEMVPVGEEETEAATETIDHPDLDEALFSL